MTCWTRFFSLVAIAALGVSPASAADVDPYVPADAEMVLSVQVRQLLDAPLVKKHFHEGIQRYLQTQPTLKRLSGTLAIDPARDVTSILVAGPVPPREEKSVVIVRGRFDLTKIQAAVVAQVQKAPDSLTVFKIGNRVAYQFTNQGDGSGVFFACFLDEGTLVLTLSRDAVQTVVARKDASKPATINKELQALIGKIDAGQTAWLASLATKELAKELGTTPELEKLFANVQHLSGGATVGDGLRVDVLVQVRDAKTANTIRQFLEGVKSIVSLAAMDSPANGRLAAILLGAITMTSSDQAVTIRGTATREGIEKSLQEKPKP